MKRQRSEAQKRVHSRLRELSKKLPARQKFVDPMKARRERAKKQTARDNRYYMTGKYG